MTFVACIVPVCPMRKEAGHRTEMVSELLFGEMAEVIEESKAFTKLRSVYEGYEGWCQTSQLTSIDVLQANQSTDLLTAEWIAAIDFNGHPMQLPMGSSLGLLSGDKGKIGQYSVTYNRKTWNPSTVLFSGEAMKMFSLQYLNTPYLWGGRSVFGIDCSGFVQQVFCFFNKKLPRDAYQQATKGEVVGFLQEAQCGDLAFFDNDEGQITHVGLLLNAETMIHASGKVRIDRIDNMGIVNTDTGERTHRLRIIKRYFGR